jgi:CelD/BcsL family acetyltransferase involved in cellulose biosynthesis
VTYERQGRSVYVDEASFVGLCAALQAQERLAIYVAELDGQPISGLGIVKDYRGVIHEWIAGTDPDYLSLGVASYMLWKVIEDFSEQGFAWFDLDGADVREIARHKSQFNGQLTLHHMVTSRNLKAKLFDASFRKAQQWGIADWLKQRLLAQRRTREDQVDPVRTPG